MQQTLQMRSITIGILLIFFGSCIIPFVNIVQADITWDATIQFDNSGGQHDYVVFGEATDANDGPPVDSNDVVKSPAPMLPYIRAWFNDSLPSPYEALSNDIRHSPDTSKIWNLSVHWMPSGGSAPTTITLSWDTTEIDDSEYNVVTLCTEGGTPLQDMLINSTYSFSCPAYVPQNFKIICTVVNQPPVVTDIPSQTIAEGSTFTTISLDNYVSDPDNTDAEMTWTYSGNTALTVNIVARVATITIPSVDWTGAETITFRATDPGSLWDTDTATFTVNNADNDPPVVTNIPDQTIAEGSTFATISLDNYVSDVDNTDAEMTWTYSGNTSLTVGIIARVATITIPSVDWTGAETITFRATDPGSLWDDDPATFTVTAVVVNDSPIFGTPTPTNTSLNNPLSLTWSILINDPENDSFNWTIQCSNGQINSQTGETNGTKSLPLSGLAYSTNYKVWVNATDTTGSGNYTRKWYTFTTRSPSSGGGGGGGGGDDDETPNKVPIANASASERFGFINTSVLFNGSRSIDSDGHLIHWSWDFGDNTNGTGEKTTHSYHQAGTYTVTLTVTDNNNATDTDTIRVIISTMASTFPTTPVINGTRTGTKNKAYTYSVYSTNQDNDLLQYTITWGDGTQNTSAFLQNGAIYSLLHTWASPGKYVITATATDNTTMSEQATFSVFIDVYFVYELGFLFDSNNDGLNDSFYTNATGLITTVQKLANGSYLLDIDADGIWDYSYSPSLGSLANLYNTETTTGFPLMYLAIAIVILAVVCISCVVFLYAKGYI